MGTKDDSKKAKAADAGKAPAKKKTASKSSGSKAAAATTKTAKASKSSAKQSTAASAKTVSKEASGTRTGGRKPAGRTITAQERHDLIAEAAYLRGEANGFLSDEQEDWVLAEAEIDQRLRTAKVTVVA